jgi:hypothetical protein
MEVVNRSITFERGEGADDVERVYRATLEGAVAPDRAQVLRSEIRKSMSVRRADAGEGAFEEAESGGVQAVADGFGRLAGEGAGVGAFENDAELVAGQHGVPFDGAHVARGAGGVVGDEFGLLGEAFPGMDDDGAAGAGAVVLGPGGEQPAEIDEGVADGGEFPVDHGGEFAGVVAEHDVGEMVVAVDDAGCEGGGAVGLEPIGDAIDAGDFAGAGPALVFAIAFEQGAPSRHLALEVALDLAEIGEADGEVIDAAEGERGVDHGQAHAAADGRVAGVKFRQADGRVEAVDGLHEVEGDAEDVLGVAGGDEAGMGDVGRGEGAEDAGLAAHDVVAVHAGMARRPAQDERASAAAELQEDVLRAAGQLGQVFKRPGLDAALVHPGFEAFEVNQFAPGFFGHVRPCGEGRGTN